jgi:hypothetical protein
VAEDLSSIPASGPAYPPSGLAALDEVAAAVAFLSWSQSSFVCGANRYVDRGLNQI